MCSLTGGANPKDSCCNEKRDDKHDGAEGERSDRRLKVKVMTHLPEIVARELAGDGLKSEDDDGSVNNEEDAGDPRGYGKRSPNGIHSVQRVCNVSVEESFFLHSFTVSA